MQYFIYMGVRFCGCCWQQQCLTHLEMETISCEYWLVNCEKLNIWGGDGGEGKEEKKGGGYTNNTLVVWALLILYSILMYICIHNIVMWFYFLNPGYCWFFSYYLLLLHKDIYHCSCSSPIPWITQYTGISTERMNSVVRVRIKICLYQNQTSYGY